MTEDTGVDQAVILVLKLSDQSFGSAEDRHIIAGIEDGIQIALADQNFGGFDGDEYGEGYCRIYVYGPNAHEASALVEAVARRYPLRSGSHIVKRLGPPGSPESITPVSLID